MESFKCRLGVLNGLKTTPSKGLLITSVGGLTSFSEAITPTFPKAELQRCVIH